MTANHALIIIWLVCLTVLVAIVISKRSDAEAVAAGLQQCVVETASSVHVVWQKECK